MRIRFLLPLLPLLVPTAQAQRAPAPRDSSAGYRDLLLRPADADAVRATDLLLRHPDTTRFRLVRPAEPVNLAAVQQRLATELPQLPAHLRIRVRVTPDGTVDRWLVLPPTDPAWTPRLEPHARALRFPAGSDPQWVTLSLR